MNGIQDTIRKLRENLGYSQRKVSQLTGISHATINRVEKGLQVPAIETIRKLAPALKCPEEKLLEAAGYFDGVKMSAVKRNIAKYIEEEKGQDERIVFVPVYSSASNADSFLSEENITGYELLPRDLIKENSEFVGLKIIDDDMKNMRIQKNDVVIVRRQNELDNNDIGVFSHNNKYIIRKHYEVDCYKVLVSGTEELRPIIYDIRREGLNILGKVVRNIIAF